MHDRNTQQPNSRRLIQNENKVAVPVQRTRNEEYPHGAGIDAKGGQPMRFAAQTKPETGVKAHRTRSARMHWIWCRDSSNGRNSAGGNAAAGEQRFP